jgi:hypothetical protein
MAGNNPEGPMRIPALLLLLPVALAAQSVTTAVSIGGSPAPTGSPTAPPAQPIKPEDLCTISGLVVNAASGEPLRRASILLMRAEPTAGENGPPLTYSGLSNSSGQFVMKDIEPGKYRLTANRNGYVPLIYGARSQGRGGTTLSLTRQQRLTDVTLKLTPHAVIVGRILDEEGEPVPNARIMLQGYRYIQGRKQLSPAGGGNNTNDLGEYRIFGVAPGKYYLSVTPTVTAPMFAIDRSATAGPEEDYVPTYYPGTTDPTAASQLDVAAGAQLRGVDMTLSKGRTVHVKGHVTHGLPGRQNISVLIAPRNPGGFMGNLRSNPVDAAGNFDIRNVTPGAYTLTAMINDGATSRQGRILVEVGSVNLEGLNVVIAAGTTVKGRIHAESEAAPVDLATIRLMLQPREPANIMFSVPSQGKPDQDGVFELKNASPDRYNLTVFGLPAGSYVKSIGTDHVDVLASGLDLTSGAPGMLEVVISPKAATMSGTIQHPKTGNPVPGASVVLVPQEKERRGQQSFYKTITSDQDGAFSLTSLAPGEYKAYAWEDVESGAYLDTDFMKPFEGKGEAVTLREGDRKSVPLKLIPADSSGTGN